jgi:hypothetical protein
MATDPWLFQRAQSALAGVMVEKEIYERLPEGIENCLKNNFLADHLESFLRKSARSPIL